jgi:putative flippase GtrA
MRNVMLTVYLHLIITTHELVVLFLSPSKMLLSSIIQIFKITCKFLLEKKYTKNPFGTPFIATKN